MNTDPASWNIFKRMEEGDEELWIARTESGRLKKYMVHVRPEDRGLCYQNHPASVIVAELRAVSQLVKRRGKEGVLFKLVRFIEPSVPWFTIEAANVIHGNHAKMIRRETLFRLNKIQFDHLIALSGEAGIHVNVKQDLAAISSETSMPEGGVKGKYISYYERNAALRSAAIKHHKAVCQVCEFDFREAYGDHGSGFIEVHHLKPISSLKTASMIDPQKDMAVVCANCHRMLHRKKDKILSIQELKTIMLDLRN